MDYFTKEYISTLGHTELYNYEKLKEFYIEMTDVLTDLFPFNESTVKPHLMRLLLFVVPFDSNFVKLGMTPELSKYQKSIFFEEAKPLLLTSIKELLPILDKKEGIVSQEDNQKLYENIMNIHASVFAFKKFFKL